jgi:uracil permease
VILIVGLGGTFNYDGGMIPMFGVELPAIATAAVVGILLNLMLSVGEKQKYAEAKKAESLA